MQHAAWSETFAGRAPPELTLRPWNSGTVDVSSGVDCSMSAACLLLSLPWDGTMLLL